MKKQLIVIAMLLMASVAFGQIKSYNLQVGDKYEMTLVSDVETDQEVMGSSQQMTQKINSTDMIEVIAINESGYEIKYTTQYRKMVITIPMAGEQTIVSDGDGPMDGALKALVNRSVNFMMDKYGNIIEFKGIEETQAAIREDLTGTQLEAQADQFVASFGEEVLRSNLEGNLSIYAGDNSKEWNRNFSTVLNQFPAQLDVKLWYDTNESILADAKVVIKGEIEQMGMAMTTDLAGTQNSIFDLSANGMPTKVQTKIDTEGNMMAQGMEIPMKMTNMTTVTFTKK